MQAPGKEFTTSTRQHETIKGHETYIHVQSATTGSVEEVQGRGWFVCCLKNAEQLYLQELKEFEKQKEMSH